MSCDTEANLEAEPEHTVGEEIAHAITHGVGALLAVLAFVVLLAIATKTGSETHIVGVGIYGISLVTLYLASTLYHAVPATWLRAKRVLQRCDHAAIYLLIAGTYTPFALLALPESYGTPLLAAMWILALFGISITAWSMRSGRTPASEQRYERISLWLYLIMGWSSVAAFKPLFDSLPRLAFGMLIAGGLAYTFGVIFFVIRRKWSHSIWHGFVMAGSGLHFYSILLFV